MFLVCGVVLLFLELPSSSKRWGAVLLKLRRPIPVSPALTSSFLGHESSSGGAVKATSIQIYTYVIEILLQIDIMNLHVFFIPLKTTETI